MPEENFNDSVYIPPRAAPIREQRYFKVLDILFDERWRKKMKKIVDLGCRSYSLFCFIKNLSNLTEIFFVDVEEQILKNDITFISSEVDKSSIPQANAYHEVVSLEFLKRRDKPLKVYCYLGSAVDPDYRLMGSDIITAIELIEHLYPDEVEAFTYNVFSYIAPKLVIITTPNVEYNVVFSNKRRLQQWEPYQNYNVIFSEKTEKFRHPDHKFEWSREQFKEWGLNIVDRYPDYTVTFDGAGDSPYGMSYIGQCTQIAVFLRKDVLDSNYVLTKNNRCYCNKNETFESKGMCMCSPNTSFGICTFNSYSNDKCSRNTQNKPKSDYYKCLYKITFPCYDDARSEEEQIIDEFQTRMKKKQYDNSFVHLFAEESKRYQIPLTRLFMDDPVPFISELELSTLLLKYGYRIENCLADSPHTPEPCLILAEDEVIIKSPVYGPDYDDYEYASSEETLSEWNYEIQETDTLGEHDFPLWLLCMLEPEIEDELATSPVPSHESHFFEPEDEWGGKDELCITARMF